MEGISTRGWYKKLKDESVRRNRKQKTEEEYEVECREEMRKIYHQKLEASLSRDSSLEILPPILFTRKKDTGSLNWKLRKVSKADLIERKDKALLTNLDIKEFLRLLRLHSVVKVGNEEDWLIDFKEFCVCWSKLPERNQSLTYFSATSFLSLESDELGRVSIMSLLNFVLRRVFVEEISIELAYYDSGKNGYLTEGDLENFFFDLIEKIPQLNELDETFHFVYVFTASMFAQAEYSGKSRIRKLFFFLDPLKKGKILIKKLLQDPMIFDIFELKNTDLSMQELDRNWFSARSTFAIYKEYLLLDKDENGLLCKEEFKAYGQLTDVVIDRIYEECNTYGGEIDYRTYLDVIISLEYKKSPLSLQFLFKILDINKCGYLNPTTVLYYLKDIVNYNNDRSPENVDPKDVMNEIFDMINPEMRGIITLKDILDSGIGDTVIAILIDPEGFMEFENRGSITN